jgi:hypothetical protein
LDALSYRSNRKFPLESKKRDSHLENGLLARRLDMSDLLQDLRYAARQFRKSPGFAVSAVFSLTLGIGATTAIFSVVYGILLDPYPYKDANRMVHVELHDKNGHFSQLLVNGTQFEDLRRASSVDDVFFKTEGRKRI